MNIDELLRQTSLFGKCRNCGWDTELVGGALMRAGDTEPVRTRTMVCPTCGVMVELRRKPPQPPTAQ